MGTMSMENFDLVLNIGYKEKGDGVGSRGERGCDQNK